jgi:FlaG/FlaF family flagellin (archaellin)
MILHRDTAVSPVVGVMLMLVVTIIIAAIVSAFAGGMTGSTSKTPQASITATITVPTAGNQTVFAHNGGDAFDLKDIKVVFQSQDTKTTLTMNDLNVTTGSYNTPKCIQFHKVGDTTGTTMIKPGDSFVIVGVNDLDYNPTYGTAHTLDYGSFTMTADTKVSWSILDKASGGTIATGTTIL